MAYTNAAKEQLLQPNESAAGLNLTATIFKCWNTIISINSCGNDIVGFFVRGKIDHISKPCRESIKLISLKCWPKLLTALGVTPKECSILIGFCDPWASPSETPFVPPSRVPPASPNKALPAKIKKTKV